MNLRRLGSSHQPNSWSALPLGLEFQAVLDNKGANAIQVVRFTVGPGQYAMDVMSVSEVVVPHEVIAVPGQPSFMEGLVSLRGEYHPAMDLRRRYGVDFAQPPAKFVVVRCRKRSLVLLVDRVGAVVWLPQSSLRDTPMKNDLGATGSVSALVDNDDAMIVLLDADNLLSEDEFSQLSAVKE